MRKTSNALLLISALSLLGPAASFGQQKNAGKKNDTVSKEETTTQDYAALAQVKEVVGRIADLDLKAGSVTFTIEASRVEPNPDAANQNQKLQQQMVQQYKKILAIKNAVQQQQAMMAFQAQLQQMQAAGGANVPNMWRVVKTSKDYEVGVLDKLKVARSTVEQKFNDEGEPIKVTAADLKKMKSPDISGAFIASADDLKPGLTVKLYLIPPKKAKKTDSARSDDKGDPTPANPLAGRPQVRMVLIINDDVSASDPPDAPKKKKGGK
jgi:hypothetical protein